MTKISEDNRRIAKTLASTFGGKASVNAYWDDSSTNSVSILQCTDSPQKGVDTFATVTLSDHPIMRDGKRLPIRTEIIGCCSQNFQIFGNVLATCAFEVINGKRYIAPGIVFRDMVSMYKSVGQMRHVLFHPPFLWDDKLQTLELSERTVAWLLAVPISESEYVFASENSVDELTDIFVENQIDIYDIDRHAVL